MTLRIFSSFLLLSFSTCLLTAQATSNAQKFSDPSRTFRFTYSFTVKDLPAGAKQVRLAVPVPQTDHHQTVRVLTSRLPRKRR